MSNILISTLLPPHFHQQKDHPSATPISFSIKLTNDLIQLLKTHSAKNNNSTKIKLIVKNGNISLKLSDSLIFPCLPLPENLTVDIYSLNTNDSLSCQYDGRIVNKLTVITDSKKIKEFHAAKSTPNLSTTTPTSPLTSASTTVNNSSNKFASSNRLTPSSLVPTSPMVLGGNGGTGARRSTYSIYSTIPENQNPYKVSLQEEHQPKLIIKKLIHLLALGPITYDHIVKLMRYSKIDSILDDYGQVYNERDQFIQEDRFPYIEMNDNDDDDDYDRFILKDRSYKELTPWKWNYDNNYERNLILNNVNNALTRLGYSLSHPLRRKILEPSDDDNNDNDENTKKSTASSSLGGGFLITSKKKSTPTPKPYTPTIASKNISIPSVNSNASVGVNNSTNTATAITTSTPSPQIRYNKPSAKRKFLSSSSSSEDDESKKLNYTSPPSSEEDTQSSSNTTTNGSSSSGGSSNNSSSGHKSKLDYYTNLANKFKAKYKEYSQLYHLLLTTTKQNEMNRPMDYKKNLFKLFELHQNLTQWKKLLWDFDKEFKLKNSLNDLHIERNQPNPIKSRPTSTIPSTVNTGSSGAIIDAHPPGIRSASPFKRRKVVMDY